jgi:hypothetical protein
VLDGKDTTGSKAMALLYEAQTNKNQIKEASKELDGEICPICCYSLYKNIQLTNKKHAHTNEIFTAFMNATHDMLNMHRVVIKPGGMMWMFCVFARGF